MLPRVGCPVAMVRVRIARPAILVHHRRSRRLGCRSGDVQDSGSRRDPRTFMRYDPGRGCLGRHASDNRGHLRRWRRSVNAAPTVNVVRKSG